MRSTQWGRLGPVAWTPLVSGWRCMRWSSIATALLCMFNASGSSSSLRGSCRTGGRLHHVFLHGHHGTPRAHEHLVERALHAQPGKQVVSTLVQIPPHLGRPPKLAAALAGLCSCGFASQGSADANPVAYARATVLVHQSCLTCGLSRRAVTASSEAVLFNQHQALRPGDGAWCTGVRGLL